MLGGNEGLKYGIMMYISGFSDGKVYVLNHLTSEKGRQMNGRRCTVVGRDSASPANTDDYEAYCNLRIRVKLLNPDTLKPEGGILRILPRNLVDARFYSVTASRAVLPSYEVLSRLNRAMEHAIAEGYNEPCGPEEFRDRKGRCDFLRSSLPDAVPHPSKCMDYMIPNEEQQDFERLRNVCVLACTGDGTVNFARFGEGLVGVGEDCAICTEPIFADAIRLPCSHMFHRECAKVWLEEHQNCPTCRKDLANSWQTYAVDADEQIQRRIEEWFLSGMCERCQASYQEGDPVVYVPLEDGKMMGMPLSEATRRGYQHQGRLQGQGTGAIVV
mmetsp:Transcript_21452/g.44105  ORF Transcript_21452/g.44105 Transcript_21452/m.44105 type:complete len:329 (+) Transcript_21452:187-1173(+)